MDKNNLIRPDNEEFDDLLESLTQNKDFLFLQSKIEICNREYKLSQNNILK